MFRSNNRGSDRDEYSYSEHVGAPRAEPGFRDHYGQYDAPPQAHYGHYSADGFDDDGWAPEEYDAYDEAGYDDATPERAGWSRMGNFMAASASLALLIGVGAWGFELVKRDVSGVPVVRALDGPMRKAPDDPGGQLAQHQGLKVNNVAAVGSAEGPADRLVLAPEPVSLTDEDHAMDVIPLPTELSRDPVVTETVEEPRFDTASAPVSGDRLPQVTSIQSTQAAETNGTPLDLSTMADRIASGTLASVTTDVVLTDQENAPLAVPTAAVAPATEVVAQAAPVLPRPRLRPQGLRVPQAQASVQLASADLDSAIRATLAEPAAQPASGGRMVQLGAVSTQAQADQEWARLSNILGPALSRYERLTQQGTSGGREIYRLRLAGFSDTDAASRFCATVRSRGPDCILVPR